MEFAWALGEGGLHMMVAASHLILKFVTLDALSTQHF